MKSSAPDLDLVKSLNSIELKEEELLRVIDEYTTARDIGVCPAAMGRIAEKRLFEECPDKANAILIRLQALAALIRDDELKHWLLEDGVCVMPAIANRALVSAAAEHPLAIVNGDITFEKESFLRRILELAEPVGSADN